jgi:hypothetical protein
MSLRWDTNESPAIDSDPPGFSNAQRGSGCAFDISDWPALEQQDIALSFPVGHGSDML